MREGRGYCLETGARSWHQEPAQYVDAILAVHRKYSDVVQKWLRNDAGFVASLDRACREIINRNAICQKNSAKSSELLVRYCDNLLRKGNRNPEAQELEEPLKNVVRGPSVLVVLGGGRGTGKGGGAATPRDELGRDKLLREKVRGKGGGGVSARNPHDQPAPRERERRPRC